MMSFPPRFLFLLFPVWIVATDAGLAQADSIPVWIRRADTLLWTDKARVPAVLHRARQIAGEPADLAEVYLALSKAYNQTRRRDSVIYYAEQAGRLYDALGDRRGLAEVTYQRAYTDYIDGRYDRAAERTVQGLEAMEALEDRAGIALGYLRLARIFHFNYKTAQSAEYGDIAGRLFEEQGDLINAADGYSFAGHGYRMEKDTAEAERCFQRHLEMALQLRLPEITTQAYIDLCSFYGDFGRPDTGVILAMKALETVREPRQRMIIHANLCQLYNALENYPQSVKYARQALDYARQANDVFFFSELPEYLAVGYAGQGRFDSAYHYMRMNQIWTDSLFRSEQDRSIQELKVAYETEKKDTLLAQRERERVLWFAAIGVLLLITLLLVERFRSGRKLNALLREKNERNELLLKEIHHRVKNNLEIVSSLLTLQAAQVETPEVLEAMQDSQSRVQSMGIIHQKLYQGEELATIEMKDYFLNLSEGLLDSFGADDRVRIELAMDELELDIDTAVPIGLIVNELMTNALKYAFPEERPGAIRIRLQRAGQNELRLEVADNGIGKEEGATKGTGFGQQLIDLLTRQLNGRMETRVAGGTRVFFRFQLQKAS